MLTYSIASVSKLVSVSCLSSRDRRATTAPNPHTLNTEKHACYPQARMLAGLINQHYGLISALVFAKAFGAELVLPAAVHRRSFGDARAAADWRSAPFSCVWDEDHLVSYWAAQNVTLHKARLLRRHPSVLTPDVAVSDCQ